MDAAIWGVALFLAAWLRHDFNVQAIDGSAFAVLAGVAGLAQVGLGALLGPYAVGHHRGSFEEAVDLTRLVSAVGLIIVACVLIVGVNLPGSVPFTSSALALVGMCAARFVIRSARTRRAARAATTHRAVVFGAGDAGRLLTRSLLDDDSPYAPVALLDDDPAKSRLRIDGVRVRGTRQDVAAVAARHRADTLIIALPQAEADLIRNVTELGEKAGLTVLTLPPIADLIGGQPTARDLRNVDVADLLGRRPVDLDCQAIADQIAGRRVLVTGAGGSIGSELCRQIARFGPDKLYMLDRDESGLHATQLSLHGHGLLDSDELILGCLRDADGMERAFRAAQPDIVFHAAALKHLPLLESHPREAFQSNVLGTLNVLRAAEAVGVGTFVNISTDKAANPTCVLGYSKRLAERLTADFARRNPGRYVSVRFGNVLGSRGSVIHAFTAQIEQGGPVTVTHPDVERYFMLIPEACQLVLQAAAMGSDGEVMVLDMGRPVKIKEVAETLIRMSGRRDVKIVYTGLRPGEKLSEDLFSHTEDSEPTTHPLINHVGVPPICPKFVAESRLPSAPDAHRSWMRHQALALPAITQVSTAASHSASGSATNAPLTDSRADDVPVVRAPGPARRRAHRITPDGDAG